MEITISLTPELVGFIQAKVQSGRYSTSSEVVRDALRLLEDYGGVDADTLMGLRDAWDAGLASGDAGALDLAELKAEGRRRLVRSTNG